MGERIKLSDHYNEVEDKDLIFLSKKKTKYLVSVMNDKNKKSEYLPKIWEIY